MHVHMPYYRQGPAMSPFRDGGRLGRWGNTASSACPTLYKALTVCLTGRGDGGEGPPALSCSALPLSWWRGDNLQMTERGHSTVIKKAQQGDGRGGTAGQGAC